MKIISFSTNKKYNTIFKFFNVIIFFTILLILLMFSKNVQVSVKNSISIFVTSLIPSLFPFLILSEFALNTNIFENISYIFGNVLSKIFKINKDSAIAVIIGFLCGFPSGSIAVNKLYEQRKITKNEAYTLLSFINNNNPAFLISTIGIAIFNNLSIGIILLISHYSASIITGIFYSRYSSHTIIHENTKISNNLIKIEKNIDSNINLIEILKKCILNAFKTLGIIFGFILIFNLLFDILNILFTKLNVNQNIVYIISAIIEITRGSHNIIKLNYSIETILCLESFLLGFSGLCIIFQIYSTISKNNFKFFKILKYKICHGIFSAIITYILIKCTNLLNVNSITILNSLDSTIIEYKEYKSMIYNAYFHSFLFILFIILICVLITIINKRKVVNIK